ncbi:MAG: ShlB/FhaC/HecB family hemolysin secretion/activation protein [Pseudomonadota bacterium]
MLALTAAAQTSGLVPTPTVIPRSEELAAPHPAVIRTQPPERPQAPAELSKPEEDERLDIAGFQLPADAPAALRATLPSLTTRFTGQDRGFEDMAGAAAEVTRWVQRELGWYLGYAYVPVQEPASTEQGQVIQLALLEGRLDRITLEWDDTIPVEREMVEAYLARLVPGDILRVRDVERVVLLVNDLRGLTAQFEVRSGSTPGTAELVVTARAEQRWNLKTEADVNGSRYLGATRLSALGQWNSPLGKGDGLTANVLSSSTGGLRFALLGYTSPFGADGFKGNLSVSSVKYALDEQLFPLKLTGDAITFNANALYPWVRSRNLNAFVIAALEDKRYEDRNIVSATRKRVNTISIGSTGDFRDSVLGGGVNTYDISVAAGRVNYPDGRPSALTDAPSFVKTSAGMTRLQNIVTGRLLGYAAVRGQWSKKNLDTTEQFRIGGPDGVRGFAPGEGTGDAGVVGSLELRVLLPEAWLGRVAREMVASVFYDAGYIRYRNQPAVGSTTPLNETFTAAGIGLAWVRPGSWSWRLTLAKPLSGEPRSDTRVRDPRLYSQLSIFFN